MSDPIRAALERLIARLDETADPDGPVPAWVDSYCAARAALAEQQGEGPSEYEWKDIGDGRPVQVQRCHKCGVCPSNVDDCGHFGDSRCPYFGIDALAAPSAPEPARAAELLQQQQAELRECRQVAAAFEKFNQQRRTHD